MTALMVNGGSGLDLSVVASLTCEREFGGARDTFAGAGVWSKLGLEMWGGR